MKSRFVVLRLAKLVRFVPETDMVRIINSLAIIIAAAQIPAFQRCDLARLFVDGTVDERSIRL
jgi:MFS superfamily sulfate permease-like transporter